MCSSDLKGQFRTVSSMKEEFERLRNNKALSAYSEAIEEIRSEERRVGK